MRALIVAGVIAAACASSERAGGEGAGDAGDASDASDARAGRDVVPEDARLGDAPGDGADSSDASLDTAVALAEAIAGTGTDAFIPMTDGGEIDVSLGMQGLHMVVGALQAYIFVLLSMVYLAGAVSEEH